MLSKSLDKERVSWLVLSAQTTTKDYIRAEHKLQSISNLFIANIVIPQVFSPKLQLKFYPQLRNAKSEKQTHVLEPIYIPGAFNTGTCMHPTE